LIDLNGIWMIKLHKLLIINLSLFFFNLKRNIYHVNEYENSSPAGFLKNLHPQIAGSIFQKKKLAYSFPAYKECLQILKSKL